MTSGPWVGRRVRDGVRAWMFIRPGLSFWVPFEIILCHWVLKPSIPCAPKAAAACPCPNSGLWAFACAGSPARSAVRQDKADLVGGLSASRPHQSPYPKIHLRKLRAEGKTGAPENKAAFQDPTTQTREALGIKRQGWGLGVGLLLFQKPWKLHCMHHAPEPGCMPSLAHVHFITYPTYNMHAPHLPHPSLPPPACDLVLLATPLGLCSTENREWSLPPQLGGRIKSQKQEPGTQEVLGEGEFCALPTVSRLEAELAGVAAGGPGGAHRDPSFTLVACQWTLHVIHAQQVLCEALRDGKMGSKLVKSLAQGHCYGQQNEWMGTLLTLQSPSCPSFRKPSQISHRHVFLTAPNL